MKDHARESLSVRSIRLSKRSADLIKRSGVLVMKSSVVRGRLATKNVVPRLLPSKKAPNQFECSACGELFQPVAFHHDRLVLAFDLHVREKHGENHLNFE
jgi:hypothetical protein